jgi:putative flippase GtrA
LGGFLLAGILALVTDGTVLQLLTAGLGLSPLLARPLSISVAMVVSWLVNRTITFQRRSAPTVGELARFAAVSWVAQAVNYAVFAAILIAVPATHPLIALVLASLVSMCVSYVGFRFGVFRATSHGAG